MKLANSIILGTTIALSLPAMAQQHEIYNQRIKTLKVVRGTDWLAMPITQLDGQAINIDFDDMTHDYHRYSYKIEHCDANWNVSTNLFDTDFLQGFNGELTIEDAELSTNTNHQYTHYHLSIPNHQVKIKMSGNYRLTVYDDSSNTPEPTKMLTACFMVVDPIMNINADYTTNTDIDQMKSHQQVKFNLDFGSLRITSPNEIKTVVLQNGRWDRAIMNTKPDYISANRMEWRHARPLIFEAGNEYRKFEFLDTDHPTMGIDDIQWDGSDYHVYIQTDTPRPSYIYDESAKGAFYIRNSDNTENNTTSEYAQVHFTLQAPQQKGDVYINGDWTYDSFLPAYRMVYNEPSHSYHATILLKQGYYSYQYLLQKKDGNIEPLASEGNFHQTKNRYEILVYYRATNERADQLVGYGSIEK